VCEVDVEVGRGGRGGRSEELERERGEVLLVGGASGGGGEVLVELVRGEREQGERGRVEREGRGEVGQALVGRCGEARSSMAAKASGWEPTGAKWSEER